MIDLSEARLLMAGRAGVFGILSEMTAGEPGLEEVENLCKYMDDLLESLEFAGGEDDMVSAYQKLAGWYEVASGLDKKWVNEKLSQEFAMLFSAGADAVGRVFPGTDETGAFYASEGYIPEKGAPGEIGVMLDFMAELSEKGAAASCVTDVKKSAAVQRDFESRFILPCISPFCEAVYNKSPDHGVYQYISVILHGFIHLDDAVLTALGKNLI